jgi:hypothetical protein
LPPFTFTPLHWAKTSFQFILNIISSINKGKKNASKVNIEPQERKKNLYKQTEKYDYEDLQGVSPYTETQE